MLSIITINYNNKAGLIRTLESVQNQVFTNFEHIVIDGDSSDGSKEVLNGYNRENSLCLSEPDQGIYNAMNKGIRKSKGDYLLFLNSGDVLFDEATLQTMNPYLEENYDLVYGDIVFDKGDEQHTFSFPDQLDFEYFIHRSLGHPTTFIKRSLFDTIGLYDETMKICSDWAFFVLAVCKHDASCKHVAREVAIFEMDGVSNEPENRALIANEKQQVFDAHFKSEFAAYNQQKARAEELASNIHATKSRIDENKVKKKLAGIYYKIVGRRNQ